MILRSRRFQHWMACLALAAILLLALLPSLGRWVEAGGQRLPPALVAMCTSAGLSLFAPDRLPSGETSPAAGMPVGMMTADDCPYCPLLAKIAPLVLAILVLHAPSTPWRPNLREAHGRRLVRASGMLGARGPPLLA
jgi:Protein of unknown function (DUF2946)